MGRKKCIAGGAGELFSVFAFSEVLSDGAVNDKELEQCVPRPPVSFATTQRSRKKMEHFLRFLLSKSHAQRLFEECSTATQVPRQEGTLPAGPDFLWAHLCCFFGQVK